MALNIDKKEMDAAWVNRATDQRFYEYIYDLAAHQVARKQIRPYDKAQEYISFAVMKCFSHVDAYKPARKSSTYAFFWKQISLSIIYLARKEARRKNKVHTFYVDEAKIMDWADQNQKAMDGQSFSEIIEVEEAHLLTKLFKKYNLAHAKGKKVSTTKANKEDAIKVLRWHEEQSPGTLEQFTSLKVIFKGWLKASTPAYN